jgi:hypothetical protein
MKITPNLQPSNMENTIDDLLFLFGWTRKKPYGRIIQVKLQAENDWLSGKNSDENPYPKNSFEHGLWFKTWFKINKNA